MKRVLLGVSLILCAALLFWLLRSTPAAGPSASDSVVEAGSAAAEPASGSLRAADVAEVSPSSPAEGRTAADVVVAENSETKEAAPTPAAADKNARDWVHLIVQDRRGAPIANADIRMSGLRTQRERGSHWGWPGEPSIGRTAKDGTAKLWFPVWTNPDDLTGELTFSVSHPDYVTKEVDGFVIGPEPRVVVLEQGAFVMVSGWITSPSEVITDVMPHVSDDVRLPEGSWQPIRDGRLSTGNIPVGEHAIYLSCERGQEGEFFSQVTRFTLAEGEQKELHLELLSARTFDGRLEDEVPRPVKDGTAVLNLLVGVQSNRGAKMMRTFTAPIDADGTFTFANLPPGDGQIIALCDGWASERVADGDEAAADPGSPEASARARTVAYGLDRIAQRVDPSVEGVFVLKMEPTASLKATLRGPDGEPAEGVVIQCWPNVRWLNGYSTMFLDRPWAGQSDARGEALITNMPSGHLMYGIPSGELDFPLENGERYRGSVLDSGKTLEVSFELEVRKE